MMILRTWTTQKSIPWKAPATLAIKRRGQDDYQPEITGLTLNAALELEERATRRRRGR